MSSKNKKLSLDLSHPKLSKEWHPTKNELTPSDVTAGSHKKVWWQCSKKTDHVWLASIASRSKGSGCPMCRGLLVVESNCLATTHPYLVDEWHLTANGKLTPYEVTAGSRIKVWWKCAKGPDHEWEARISHRSKGIGCPICSNKKVVKSNCLATIYPELAREWEITQNGKLTPFDVVPGSHKTVWWICSSNNTHIWKTSIKARAGGTGCPFCRGLKVNESNCLLTTHPEIAAHWHPMKNGKLMPSHVVAGSDKIVWWKCPKGTDHEWKTNIYKRVSGRGCPVCCNQKIVRSNSLGTTHPELAKQLHPFKNKKNSADSLSQGSPKKVWWQCQQDKNHIWQATVASRAAGTGCPFCNRKKIDISNCLATTHPELAKEFHSSLNKGNSAYNLSAGSGVEVWWQCSQDSSHEWKAPIHKRSSGRGCPYCSARWTVRKLRHFISSLLPYLEGFSEAELYSIFQQTGLLDITKTAKGYRFVQILKSNKFPKEELEKFVNEQSSAIDAYLNTDSCEDGEKLATPSIDPTNSGEEELPIIETKDVLSALEGKIYANLDGEVIDFLLRSAIAKIWKHAFFAEGEAFTQLSSFNVEGAYAKKVKNTFMQEYKGATELEIPEGYTFKYQPNLMQRYTAYQLKSLRRMGNWSGTGAGKTLSAILGSRVINAKLTLICCPNNVIDNWERAIKQAYPNSIVYKKGASLNAVKRNDNFQYIILNYEFFQQPGAQKKLKEFLKKNVVDLVIIDEVHFSKRRSTEGNSIRSNVISKFLYEASCVNENLHVLGMSATPVLNNLYEGKALIELIAGTQYDDLKTEATVSNCVKLYQKFISHGIRWIPAYKTSIIEHKEYIDCKDFLDEIRQNKLTGSLIGLEGILTKAKIPYILMQLQSKTIVYSHYRQHIDIQLYDAIVQAGWRVAFFNGDDKTGLKAFIDGDADILIASTCIGTGIDGLQNVCSRLIINSLPWTHAEYKQLIGRIYRQGQTKDLVEIFIPVSYIDFGSERWSHCQERWNRIQFKRSLSDTAVDGVIPEGHLRTPAQAYKDAMNWLSRLDQGELYEIERQKINAPLDDINEIAPLRSLSDLSRLNQRINNETSQETHQRFLDDPKAWHNYHEAYRTARADWDVIPYKEAISWAKSRPHMRIADFGCGEAFLAQELSNKVFSFDHIAINEKVIACDMAKVPLSDASINAAIFSLSLMGTNFVDYLKEAARCLKLDGHLWIAEPTSRIHDIDLFKQLLERLGFNLYMVQQKGRFTFIQAIKSDRMINEVGLKEAQINKILS